eukprot:CAMPEP_0177667840 /NCGR_PEP_ID=MMETSP0447-20121125/22361_1 /TAXON_ID=0 /ORGANISM="Stygamoeba regulata, Strain BSH-02190019" /LENGTH=151 /DNA_ID=CAMNT_0019174145 /DNA_START=45 /DNA_END=500 /DNA_ORIENTATION=-
MSHGKRLMNKPLEGVVVRLGKMMKTTTVLQNNYYYNYKYDLYVKRTKKVHLHDPNGIARMGDLIRFRQCRPISKLKHHEVVEVLWRQPTTAFLEANPEFESLSRGALVNSRNDFDLMASREEQRQMEKQLKRADKKAKDAATMAKDATTSA